MVEQREVVLPRTARYLIDTPEPPSARRLLVVALHGYGMRPGTMLELTKGLFQAQPVIASLEGPNSHFTGAPSPTSEVAYNWGTHETADFHWKFHHEFLLTVIPQMQQLAGVEPARTILVGFSQPVGMNYRFVAAHAGLVRGVIGICGGVPRNWEYDSGRVDAALLHIARSEDEYFAIDTVSRFENRLKARAADVEFHLLAGKHRFPSNASGLVEEWLGRIL